MLVAKVILSAMTKLLDTYARDPRGLLLLLLLVVVMSLITVRVAAAILVPMATIAFLIRSTWPQSRSS